MQPTNKGGKLEVKKVAPTSPSTTTSTTARASSTPTVRRASPISGNSREASPTSTAVAKSKGSGPAAAPSPASSPKPNGATVQPIRKKPRTAEETAKVTKPKRGTNPEPEDASANVVHVVDDDEDDSEDVAAQPTSSCTSTTSTTCTTSSASRATSAAAPGAKATAKVDEEDEGESSSESSGSESESESSVSESESSESESGSDESDEEEEEAGGNRKRPSKSAKAITKTKESPGKVTPKAKPKTAAATEEKGGKGKGKGKAKTSVKKEKNAELKRLLKDPKRTVRSVILEQNRKDMALLARVVSGELSASDFKSQMSERLAGQWQLGTSSFNIRPDGVACKHVCTYCYVAPMFKRWGRKCVPPGIEELMPVDKKKVQKTWKKVAPENREMIFFPSSCDVFAENAQDYVTQARRIIDAGHEIFFPTKPTKKSITALAHYFGLAGPKYKAAVQLFITVTTNDEEVLHRFEPRASSYAERLECIRIAAENGFNVNAICEPYLTDPTLFVPALLEMLPPSGVVAVGKMNYSAHMELSSDPAEDASMKAYLADLYSEGNVMKVYRELSNNPRIIFKKETMMGIIKIVTSRKKKS
ncbi:hypothetical protein Pelo_15330 [Pelomyxa schiedti]|nr:hypothetical protein Pelo_15330 [Pelomyxa schiedti]